MAQNAYVGVGNKAREVSKMYIGTPNTRANNVIKNGTLAETSAKWYIDSRMGVTQHAGYITVKANSTATSGTFPNYQLFESTISGSTQETNRVIFSAAMVRGRTTNVGTPRVYLRRYMNGTSTIQYVDLRVDGRTDSANNLNDGNWHLVCSYDTTYWTNNYATYDRIAFGTNTTTLDDEMDICNVFICDVTEAFGRGKEKDKNWLIDNLYYKAFSIIYNGALSSDYHNWMLSNGTATAVDNSIMLTPSSAGSRPEIKQEFETVDPGNSDEIIFSCVEVKGSLSNTSCPTINMIPVTGGGIYQTTSFDGKSGLQINDGEWHPMGLYLKIGQNNAFKTMRTIRLCTTFDSSMPTSTTDSYYFKNARVYNLTKIFGAGNEPTYTWCKENLVYGGYKDTNVIPTYFSSSIAPTDWVLSSDKYSAKAGNAYGEWQVIGENVANSGSSLIDFGFDNDTSTYFATGSKVGNVKPVYMRTPVYIRPESIYIRYAWVDENSTIEAYNNKTNTWDVFGTLDYAGSTITNLTISVDTQNFYNYFRINAWWSSSSNNNNTHLYEFRISSGYINNGSTNYLVIPNADTKTVARKVIKAYIGVDGVAEQCFPSNKHYTGITFNGHASQTLSVARNSYGHSASAGDYALIMGGMTATSSSPSNVVEAYSPSMIKSTLSSLTTQRRGSSATSFNGNAIVCGGYSGSAYINTYEYYTSDLSHSTGTLDYTVNNNAMASNGDYCIIAGGYGTAAPTLRPAVLAINKDMVKMVVGNISQGRENLMATSFNTNAMFCGGKNTSTTYYTNVDVYDENLVRTLKYLPHGKYSGVAESTSQYAFIMGGMTGSTTAVNTTIIFDTNFTRSTGTTLSEGVGFQAGLSMPNFVASICGISSNNTESSVVEIYDNSLVKTTEYAGRAIGNVGCARAGEYIYVFGGSYYVSGWTYIDAVQVFKLNY